MSGFFFAILNYEVAKFKVAEFLNYKVSEGKVFEFISKEEKKSVAIRSIRVIRVPILKVELQSKQNKNP